MSNLIKSIKHNLTKIILGNDIEAVPSDIRMEMEIRIDRKFSQFIFIFQFSFYFVLFYIPNETVSLVFVNHLGITIFAAIIALFAKFEILVSPVLNLFLGMIHIIIFLTIGQLQYLTNGALSVEYLNNFYISLSLLVVFHSIRFSQSSCLLVGFSFIILHLISLLFLARYSEDFLTVPAFLPTGVYFLAMAIGTIVILNRRRDIEKIIKLNKEKSAIAEELKLAKKVQDTLFPYDVEFNGLRFEVFRQSHNYIGGDFYDFVQLREGNIGVFFTDIAGHGISSAMVASIMKVMVATIPYQMKLNPVKLLSHLDLQLYKNLDNYHASAIYLYIDFQTKKMTLGNAGHPYIIYCPVGSDFEELETEGSILGFKIREPIVESIEIDFKVGDRFFLYTDGLIESPTELNKHITQEDLLQILNKRKSIKDISIMKELIVEDIYKDHHLKHFTDDTMFLLFEIKERI